jgi:hypothetical protein
LFLGRGFERLGGDLIALLADHEAAAVVFFLKAVCPAEKQARDFAFLDRIEELAADTVKRRIENARSVSPQTVQLMVYIPAESDCYSHTPPFQMADSPLLSSDRHAPTVQVACDLPDPTICRGNRRGESVWCLVESSGRCPFSLPFGYGRICKNPDRAAIVARTEADRPEQPWRDRSRRGFLTIGEGSWRTGSNG